MFKKDIKIMTVNLDYTLAMNDPKYGDAQHRNIDYGNYVDKIFSITHSSKKMDLKNKKLSDRVEIFPTSSIHPIMFVFDALKIAKPIFKSNNFDLVLTQDPFITGLVGYLLKLKYHCPLLIHFHGDFWQNKYWLRDKWYNFILLWLSKFLVNRADGIRVVSSGIKEKLIDAGIDGNKIRVISTPVNLEKFSNYNHEKVEQFRQKHSNRKLIINVGRNDLAKDYKTLFKTIKLVKEKYGKISFWQVGANLRLSDKINVDEKIILSSTDKINLNELVDYYHASDIYVSSSRHESLGKVLIEAMACGLPVVATSTTGSKEIIDDRVSGFLVPISDSKALAEKIIYLLNNPDMAKKMGEAGRNIVKNKFDYNKLVLQTVQFWYDLTNKS